MANVKELEIIRKKQILDAAINQIAAHGSAKIKMDDIAKASKLSKGGIAHYFSSKDDILTNAFKSYFDFIFQTVKDEALKYDDPREILSGFTPLYDRNSPEIETAYPVLLDFMAAAVHNSIYRKIFQDWVDKWIEILKGAIDEGIKRGIFKNIDSRHVAQTISAIYQGIATRWFLCNESHSSEWAIQSFKSAIQGVLKPYMV